MKVTLSCDLCTATHDIEVPMPQGWDSVYDGVHADRFLCPSHAAIQPFTDSQCPGCVGGFGDCPLFNAFAYSKFELTESDFQQLERGVCPKRVGGTFSISANGVEEMDLTSEPISEAGSVLAQAIKDQYDRYHKGRSS